MRHVGTAKPPVANITIRTDLFPSQSGWLADHRSGRAAAVGPRRGIRGVARVDTERFLLRRIHQPVIA
jgi:hypothetical protein